MCNRCSSYHFPGWWSKIELFNPDHPVIGNRDLLYFDLDTVIMPTARLKLMCQRKPFTMLRDWYSPYHVNSSIMYIPKETKYKVWDIFIENPTRIMSLFRPLTLLEINNRFLAQQLFDDAHDLMSSIVKRNLPKYLFNRQGLLGDQGFIGMVMKKRIWEGFKIYSYKKHIAGPGCWGYQPNISLGNGSLPCDAEIICFHGKPRPFELGFPWIPRLPL